MLDEMCDVTDGSMSFRPVIVVMAVIVRMSMVAFITGMAVSAVMVVACRLRPARGAVRRQLGR